MNPHIESKLQRIQRLSSLLRGICSAIQFPIIIAAVAGAIAAIAGRLTNFSYFGQNIPIVAVTLGSRLALAVLVLLTGAVLAKMIYHLRRLFGSYVRRDIFTAESARQIRHIGISCLLWGVAKIAWALLPLALQPNPTPAVTVPLDYLLIGAVVIVISWFTEMAAALREENDLTI